MAATPSTRDSGTCRILLVSRLTRLHGIIEAAAKQDVTLLTWPEAEKNSKKTSAILEKVRGVVDGRRVESVAILAPSTQSSNHMAIELDANTKISMETLHSSLPIAAFWKEFGQICFKNSPKEDGLLSGQLHLFGVSLAQTEDGRNLLQCLHNLWQVPVTVSSDVFGEDVLTIPENISLVTPPVLGQLYFKADKLKIWQRQTQGIAGFERIRLVGKGAYGAAVLYRKKDDNSLVIIKEINMHDLKASDRLRALNEVKVLSMLDHPNIVSYYDSFEEDGVLMIEMEYADGGTLAQHLSQQEQLPTEQNILGMFSQIAEATRYIHARKVLHRDIKTANIFLTRENQVKLGDFGISKVLSDSKKNAETVLGTPYYISPEICEGKDYNDKSDIWSLGCVLYEMACGQRTFDGTNLPALVTKIMTGSFTPIRDTYSEGFRQLVAAMLKHDPQSRPSAEELCIFHLPKLLPSDNSHLVSANISSNEIQPTTSCSVVYLLDMSSLMLHLVPLPPIIHSVFQVSVGEGHAVIVTTMFEVLSWGINQYGQLGHGHTSTLAQPEIISALKGKSTVGVGCGEDFTIFYSQNGIVMSCGSGGLGCLGHGNSDNCYKPRLVESLLGEDADLVTCGPQHVVVLLKSGTVATWGCGADGRLGLGSVQNQYSPQKVALPDNDSIKLAACGSDGTMLLSTSGRLLASGNNADNKLGLNSRFGFLMQFRKLLSVQREGHIVCSVNTFTPVPAFQKSVVTGMHLGAHHSTIFLEAGRVRMLGSNSCGQLGTGDRKMRQEAYPLNQQYSQNEAMICGSQYTMCLTNTKCLLVWGGVSSQAGRMSELVKSMGVVSDHRQTPVQHERANNDDFCEQTRNAVQNSQNSLGTDQVVSVNNALAGMAMMSSVPISPLASSTPAEEHLTSAMLPWQTQQRRFSVNSQKSSAPESRQTEDFEGTTKDKQIDVSQNKCLSSSGNEMEMTTSENHRLEDISDDNHTLEDISDDKLAFNVDAMAQNDVHICSQKVTLKRVSSARPALTSSSTFDSNILLSPHELVLSSNSSQNISAGQSEEDKGWFGLGENCHSPTIEDFVCCNQNVLLVVQVQANVSHASSARVRKENEDQLHLQTLKRRFQLGRLSRTTFSSNAGIGISGSIPRAVLIDGGHVEATRQGYSHVEEMRQGTSFEMNRTQVPTWLKNEFMEATTPTSDSEKSTGASSGVETALTSPSTNPLTSPSTNSLRSDQTNMASDQVRHDGGEAKCEAMSVENLSTNEEKIECSTDANKEQRSVSSRKDISCHNTNSFSAPKAAVESAAQRGSEQSHQTATSGQGRPSSLPVTPTSARSSGSQKTSVEKTRSAGTQKTTLLARRTSYQQQVSNSASVYLTQSQARMRRNLSAPVVIGKTVKSKSGHTASARPSGGSRSACAPNSLKTTSASSRRTSRSLPASSNVTFLANLPGAIDDAVVEVSTKAHLPVSEKSPTAHAEVASISSGTIISATRRLAAAGSKDKSQPSAGKRRFLASSASSQDTSVYPGSAPSEYSSSVSCVSCGDSSADGHTENLSTTSSSGPSFGNDVQELVNKAARDRWPRRQSSSRQQRVLSFEEHFEGRQKKRSSSRVAKDGGNERSSLPSSRSCNTSVVKLSKNAAVSDESADCDMIPTNARQQTVGKADLSAKACLATDVTGVMQTDEELPNGHIKNSVEQELKAELRMVKDQLREQNAQLQQSHELLRAVQQQLTELKTCSSTTKAVTRPRSSSICVIS